MNLNHILFSDLSLTLSPGEEVYIHIFGSISTCILSSRIINSSGSYVIQSSINSTELFAEVSSKNDLQWENIRINGIEYSEITFDITSLLFNSPNILYAKNTSLTNKIEINLRGNK